MILWLSSISYCFGIGYDMNRVQFDCTVSLTVGISRDDMILSRIDTSQEYLAC